MTAVSDYGSTLTFNSVSIGKCIVTGFPEVVDNGVTTTNHSGGGYASSIPSGLVTVGEITLSVLNESGVYTALRLLQTNKTVATAVITNGIDTIQGSAWVKSVKPEDADANSPKANGIAVVIVPTGSWT